MLCDLQIPRSSGEKLFAVIRHRHQPPSSIDELPGFIENAFRGHIWRRIPGVWIIHVPLTAGELLWYFDVKLHQDDRLLIVELTGSAAWSGFPDNAEPALAALLSRSQITAPTHQSDGETESSL